MFIYTVNDILGAIALGLLLLAFLFYAGVAAFYTLKRKWKNKK